ncbi:uncharacterized protein Triagg1_5185 [Trichoderma aggressivum f. europaeum]|uniref:Uncharacterized protein n=1 Tax=Trichoderma aggressivum f. europaeum TaxID=173218 RepID=A0AAE1IF42_9HYPO|nr:hypothetical protein Triagg1_5185 [Trichoderma aggressivum f. europaeum]
MISGSTKMPWFEDFSVVARPAYFIFGLLLLAISSTILARRVTTIYNLFYPNRDGRPDSTQPPWYELVDEHAVDSESGEESGEEDNWL